MNPATIAQALENRQGGGLYHMKVVRPARLLKSAGDKQITRVHNMTGQLALYAARGPVREAVENGERAAPVLPSHIERSFYIGRVRFWEGKKGNIYLPVTVAKDHAPEWYMDGEQVALDRVAEFLTAAEKTPPADKAALEADGKALFFGVKVENITEIH